MWTLQSRHRGENCLVLPCPAAALADKRLSVAGHFIRTGHPMASGDSTKDLSLPCREIHSENAGEVASQPTSHLKARLMVESEKAITGQDKTGTRMKRNSGPACACTECACVWVCARVCVCTYFSKTSHAVHETADPRDLIG